MQDLTKFIAEARAKGLSDDDIRNTLQSQGWDDAQVNLALAGISVPAPRTDSNIQPDTFIRKDTPKPSHPSLNPLLAAVHHILLWFFMGSSTVTIVGAVASLFGDSVSTEALAAMIAVTVATFVPYAVMFAIYLAKARRTPGLIPGKVWSIITICLSSIGAMGALITLVINTILDIDVAVLISAALIFLLNAIIIKAYVFAAFMPVKLQRLRKVILLAYLPVLALCFGTLSVMSLLQLGPAKHDQQLQEALEKSVRTIVTYTKNNDKIPTSDTEITLEPGVRYNYVDQERYQVCADFQTGNQDSYGYRSSYDQEDSYVSSYDFTYHDSGEECFEFKSGHVAGRQN